MAALLDTILPVFLVLGFGYVAVWKGLFTQNGVDGLMSFTQNFAFPCLLFRALATLDLGQDFHLPLLFSFYAGALSGFVVGLLGARLIFGRPWEDSVAIGFVGLFSNSLMLGLPITERAFGPDALSANYAIIALHAPFCYLVGFTTMEAVRGRGGAKLDTLLQVVRSMFRNALVVGIALGLVVNLAGVTIPMILDDALALVARAGLPAALFALGGVLVQYRPEGDLRIIAFICAVSLVMHPAIVWGLGMVTDLDQARFRSAVITAAMAPGVNAYVFANIYGVAKRVAASAVLLGTAVCMLTAWFWLAVLP
ncbi:MAG: AEC family transporter [Rhodobacteraceae bacterium]|nr:AEC family transporter [Paracoccaceae bacterium]